MANGINGKKGLQDRATEILAGLLVMLISWTAYENIQSIKFRHAGDRCTAKDCGIMQRQIDNNAALINGCTDHIKLLRERVIKLEDKN